VKTALGAAIIAPLDAAPRVEVGEPRLVAEGPAEERRWGYYQFPNLEFLPGGRILARFHVLADAAESYGSRPSVPDRAVSPDGGNTWTLLKQGAREWAGEPSRLEDSEALRYSLHGLRRTTGGLGVGPMYLSRSPNLGKTWSKPVAFTKSRVLPRLLLLGNGVLVLGSGCPGASLRVSFDGRGERWTEPCHLVPLTSGNVQADSCGYTSLLPLDAGRFLVAYSWFRRQGADGKEHKSILVRRVEVKL
jgi:hypothetical protein